MSELRGPLYGLAEQAKTCDVIDRAGRRASRRRWIPPAGACAAVLAAAAGTVAGASLYGRPAQDVAAGAEPPAEPTGTAAIAPPPPAPPVPTACTARWHCS